MELQGGGGYGRRQRPLDGSGDGGGFGRAGGQEENSFGLENCADAHGDGALRNLFARRKKFAIVFRGVFAENLQASARADAGSRLIETDVSIAADAEDLQVDAAGAANILLVRSAVLLVIAFDRAVRNMDVARRNIDLGEEVLLHEMPEAPGVIRGEAQILVEFEGTHAGKILGIVLVQ